MLHFLAQQAAPASTNIVNLANAINNEITQEKKLVNDMLARLGEHGDKYVLNVLIAGMMCLAGICLIRLITFSTRKAIQRSGHANVLFESFICSVVHKLGWGVLLMLILQRLGLSEVVAPLIAGVSVAGFVIGFACQESLANLAAGMMIALNNPFKVGDYVSAGGVEGAVTELNVMATTLLTGDNKRITVPNKVIWGSSITNFSAMERRRVEIAVSIPYGSDIAKAQRVALDALRANPRILAEPPPIVEVVALGASSINFVVRPWCETADYWKVHFSATAALNEAFAKNGIKIAIPEQVVHVLHPALPSPGRDGDRTY